MTGLDLAEEAEALAVFLAHLDGSEEDLTGPLGFVRRSFVRMRASDPGEFLIMVAMAKILGIPTEVSMDGAEEGPADQQVFRAIVQAWTLWSRQENEEGLLILSSVEDLFQVPRGGAIHLLALRPWHEAVEALLHGDRERARRLFRRSIEIGGQMGTESNPAIQWAFVASFFEHG